MDLELYPFESRTLDLQGLRYHYLDEGAGDPIVMVHGNPTWSFHYRRLVLALRDRHRCIVPDHIGCGLSDKPPDARYSYTLEQRVHDLATLLDHLGLDRDLTLVLHDWGGMIGMTYAVRHPERIRRLILLNTAAFPLPPGKRFPLGLRLCRGPLGAVLVRGLNLFAAGAARVGCKRRPLPRAVRRELIRPYDSWQHRIAVHRFVQDIPLRPRDPAYAIVREVESRLSSFRDTPTLIGWGERDFVFDRHFLAAWRRHLPNAEVHAFADCGHYVLEDAFDRLLPLIEAFLARPPSPAAMDRRNDDQGAPLAPGGR